MEPAPSSAAHAAFSRRHPGVTRHALELLECAPLAGHLVHRIVRDGDAEGRDPVTRNGGAAAG